ncbi:MAG: PEP-CTERM sorting domain-containing protein [Planctomycetota bacterium]|jgi:hypothetical protein
MKVKTLSVLAGLGGSLLVGNAAQAAFTGLVVEEKPNEWAFTCNVYAQFSDPLDVGYAVAGTPGAPMNISVNGGTFYQTAVGNDQAPNPAFFGVFPSLEFDTFVTIGKKTSVGDETALSPGWPGFGPSTLGGTNLGWFVTPVAPQAVPDASGRVLLGQFGTADGLGISGTFLLQWDDPTGNTTQEIVSFEHNVPAPGALALLGVAGLMGTRRRRR